MQPRTQMLARHRVPCPTLTVFPFTARAGFPLELGRHTRNCQPYRGGMETLGPPQRPARCSRRRYSCRDLHRVLDLAKWAGSARQGVPFRVVLSKVQKATWPANWARQPSEKLLSSDGEGTSSARSLQVHERGTNQLKKRHLRFKTQGLALRRVLLLVASKRGDAKSSGQENPLLLRAVGK